MTKTSNVGKIIAIFLVITTLFSSLVITSSAASYKTGYYTVGSNSGSNVRKGAGTGYSVVGAASKGIKFYVSKVNGSWGYTDSIKCTNGYRSGWISLQYCNYNGGGSSGNSSRSTYNDVFASTKGNGYTLAQGKSAASSTFTKGTFVYVWAYVHDANGNLYSTYSSGTCTMTLSIYRPDGTCANTYTYKNSDNNWIGTTLNQAGTWKIQSKISGSISGTNTQTITVKEKSSSSNPAANIRTLSYNVNGGSGSISPQVAAKGSVVTIRSDKPTRSGYTFLGWSTDKNATTASYFAGDRVRLNGSAILYAVWKKNNVNPTSVKLNGTSCSMNVGTYAQLRATVYPTNASQTVYWSSSNSNVVTVSSSGTVKAINPGVATVTAKTPNGKTATFKFTVRGIEISGGFGYTAPTAGDIFYLSAKAYPNDTSKFTWSTSNSKIVSVSSSGKITAKAPGTATITAKTADGRSRSVTIRVSSANKWRTGNFDSGYTARGYTTVWLNKNAGSAKIRIYTYDMTGAKTSGAMHIVLRDLNGNWIREFDAKSGDTLKLGNDYPAYRVYIAKKSYPNNWIGDADDFINVGKCQSWAINCTSNCYI